MRRGFKWTLKDYAWSIVGVIYILGCWGFDAIMGNEEEDD